MYQTMLLKMCDMRTRPLFAYISSFFLLSLSLSLSLWYSIVRVQELDFLHAHHAPQEGAPALLLTEGEQRHEPDSRAIYTTHPAAKKSYNNRKNNNSQNII